ncbi:MAG: gluconokinase [Burkholderiales bacterium PBB3]|nr:MAG: gluconokinase [Burkholderiales bacterium PBB3]
MGVSGCGKSSVAAAVAARLGLVWVEGDDHHPASNIERMRSGLALTDADRAEWLDTLGDLLSQHQPHGVVMTCSALKQTYRQKLRACAPDVRFVFMDLSPDAALQRVQARGSSHFMPTSLVQSQFAALESPIGEPGVLQVDATLPRDAITQAVLQWLQAP